MDTEKIRRLPELIGELLSTYTGEESLTDILLESEIVILCLEGSDTIDGEVIPVPEALVWHEVSAALKRIAYAAMELQVVRENAGSAFEQHRAALAEIRRAALRICGLLRLSCELPEVPGSLPVREPGEPSLPADEESAELQCAGHALQLVDEEEHIKRLRRELQLLREELSALLSEKDSLELFEGRALRARYAVEIESLLTELYQLEYELRYTKRKIQLIQASLNRRETVSLPQIEAQLQEEHDAYCRKVDEFIRQVQEAREYEKQRESRLRKDGASGDDGDDVSSPEAMKKLYRKIVKAMHPDLHPDQTEKEAELFKKANLAYENGDGAALQRIWRTVNGGAEPEQDGPTRLEALLKERARLTGLILQVRREIADIRSSFPFTVKDILNDPDKLAERQEQIRSRIAETGEALKRSREKLEELEKKI